MKIPKNRGECFAGKICAIRNSCGCQLCCDFHKLAAEKLKSDNKSSMKFLKLEEVDINCNRFDSLEDLVQHTIELGVIRRVYNFIYRKLYT